MPFSRKRAGRNLSAKNTDGLIEIVLILRHIHLKLPLVLHNIKCVLFLKQHYQTI